MIKKMIIQFLIYVTLAFLVVWLTQEHALHVTLAFFIAFMGGMFTQMFVWDNK